MRKTECCVVRNMKKLCATKENLHNTVSKKGDAEQYT